MRFDQPVIGEKTTKMHTKVDFQELVQKHKNVLIINLEKVIKPGEKKTDNIIWFLVYEKQMCNYCWRIFC